jgi:CyaY protein
MISDSDFLTAADATLDAIGRALDDALAVSDADVDWTLNDGILTIEPEGGGRVIVNRHVPNREIWVAAKSGGFHFRAVDGQWRDTRSGEELGAALAALLGTQAGLSVRLDALRAPAA